MGFLDNLGKTLSDASQGAIQKGKEFADVAKFNSLISEEEKKIKNVYEQLGRKYVELKGESPEEDFKEYIGALNTSFDKIKEYQKNLIELKGVTNCPNCGAEVQIGAMFCPVCGTKMDLQQADASVKRCGDCGAVIPEGSKFCTTCGKPVEE